MVTSSRRQRLRDRMQAGESPALHGPSGYINWGCRCEVCRESNAAAHAAKVAKPPRGDKHGTMLNYRRGCRCEACAGAQRAEYAKRKLRKQAG